MISKVLISLLITSLVSTLAGLVMVQCPCDEKVRQDIEMRFDMDVIYQCNKCNKNIKVVSDIKTLLTTEPIYSND